MRVNYGKRKAAVEIVGSLLGRAAEFSFISFILSCFFGSVVL